MECNNGGHALTTTPQHILWIDDDADRKNASETLQEILGVRVDFCEVNRKKIMDIIEGFTKGLEPALILMDHWLNDIEGPSERGSSIAEILREKWNDCPIVAITGMADELDEHEKYLYEEVIPIEDLSTSHSLLMAIVAGFRELRANRPNSIDDIVDKLNAPSDDREMLISIIPKQIRSNFKDKSLLINIYKWIRHELYERPGLLYDNLWASTLIGIKIESFNKVKATFKTAEYNGLFSDAADERWWKSIIKDILFEALPDEKAALPWFLGFKLPGLSEADKSSCYRDDCTETDPPDTVAYTDGTLSTRKPMHRKCTVKHPLFESLLYFEEIRMMGMD